MYMPIVVRRFCFSVLMPFLEERPEQGSPLLFGNTVQPLLTYLASELNLGYLNDVTLGGPVDTVAADVAEIAKVCGNMGLFLN